MIFWNSAAVLAHSKVSCVPLVTFGRVFFTTPSSFSVTVSLSPSASLGVYLKLNAAVLLPRFTPLAPLVLVIVGGVFVEGRTKAGRMPYELDALPTSQLPLERTSHTLKVSSAYGERSHQWAAEPFRYAMRLFSADEPVPDSK